MKRRDFRECWRLSDLRTKGGFLEGAVAPQDPDRAGHDGGGGEFAKLAIPVLAAKWRRVAPAGAFNRSDRCLEVRAELAALPGGLHQDTRALAAVADVEDLIDLTHLEQAGP